MFLERGTSVDHITSSRWVLRLNYCSHEAKKSLQQGIETDHFRLKRVILKNGWFQSFHTAKKTLKRYEVILWIKKGLGFKGK